MNYCNIKFVDIANGPGCRTTLFVSGCRNHCKGCFQPETWDFNYGKLFCISTYDKIIESLKPDYIRGLTILGGEPFEPENQKELLPFLCQVRKHYKDNKDIWVYTGYVYDKDLINGGRKEIEETDRILKLIDVLVDGPFIEERKNISLQFRGSDNQRIINMKETIEAGNIELWKE